jgi:predicted permease
MESTNNDANVLLDIAINQLNVMVSYLPSILAVVLILGVGWSIARLARRAARKIGAASNRVLARAFPSGIFSGARMSSLAVTLISEVVFWATILITATMAARFAELGSVSQWLDRITAHLPNLIAGIGIVVVGYFLSVFAREQLISQTSNEQLSSNSFKGRIAQAVVVSIAFIIGLDQVGIDVALLIGLTVVAAAGILTAVAVAFALAARTHISNLIGVRAAHDNLRPGMTIQVGDIQGDVVELTSTLIALDTDKGRVLVPGKLVDEAVITVMSPISNQEETYD